MQAAVALSKLKVKNVRLDTGVGGIPDLTPEDIAAGLAGCKPGPVYLGLYKYSGDNTSLPLLEQHVMAHVGIQGYAQKLFDDKDYSAICRYLNIWIKGVSVESSNALTEDERNWCKTLHQLVRLLVNDVVLKTDTRRVMVPVFIRDGFAKVVVVRVAKLFRLVSRPVG